VSNQSPKIYEKTIPNFLTKNLKTVALTSACFTIQTYNLKKPIWVNEMLELANNLLILFCSQQIPVRTNAFTLFQCPRSSNLGVCHTPLRQYPANAPFVRANRIRPFPKNRLIVSRQLVSHHLDPT